MTMALNNLSLNLNKTLLVSLAMHGGIFLTAVYLAAPARSPLPIGMEVRYNEAPPVVAKVQKSAVLVPTLPGDVAQPRQENTETVSTVPELAPATALNVREGVANGSEVTPEQRYIYEVQKLLERRKSYPLMAKKMGHTGTVVMSFTLMPDGKLVGSEMVQSSEFASLNQAAQDLIKGIDGLKPFPSEIKRTSWTMTIPIRYELR